MRRKQGKTTGLLVVTSLILVLALTGCGQKNTEASADRSAGNTGQVESTAISEQTELSKNTESLESEKNDSMAMDETIAPERDENGESSEAVELEVRFGDNGAPFTMHLYENDTAAAIARHVGTASWRLPIYHYDDYDNWESMQYYDIPSRYEIPSDAETITSAKGGEVYYSEPNRIVLFYHDAEISAEYTKVGYFDYTDEFVSAVEKNPVLDGWDNKIVLIQSMD